MRPGREEGILTDEKWNIEGHDDADAIADALKRRAIRSRKHTQKGLLDSLAHPASYEDENLVSVVIDPEHVASFCPGGGQDAVRHAVEPKLREWLDGRSVGKRQRALYALVQWNGPSSELVAPGLAGAWYEKEAVFEALEGIPTLPASLVPSMRALLTKKAFDAYAATQPWEVHYARLVSILARIDAPERNELLLQALDIDELRPNVARALGAGGADPAVTGPLRGAIRSRFCAAVEVIGEARTKGLPQRAAVALATSLAGLVDRDVEMARAALSVFDLLPGVEALSHTVAPLAELLARSVDLLSADEIDRLATFMTIPPPERLPAAAAAWVRLPVDRAEVLAKRFHEGDRALADRRQDAIAAAHWANPKPQQGIAALIAPRALAASASHAPPEVAGPLLIEGIRKARNPAELETAVQRAAELRIGGATRPLLLRLRETPFRISPALEGPIAALLEPDDSDWVEQEIDGDNPFTDRRQALRRCLAEAKKRW